MSDFKKKTKKKKIRKKKEEHFVENAEDFSFFLERHAECIQ